MIDGALDLSGEARDRDSGNPHDLVGVGVERAERPPGARGGRGPELGDGEEVATVEADRRLGSGGRRAPGRIEELAVRLGETHRPRRDAFRAENRDRGILGQQVGERHQLADERGGERLHPLDRDALGDLGEHPLETRELALHLLRPLPHVGRQQHLAAGQQVDRAEVAVDRALVGDRERPQRLDLVAEEVGAHGMLGIRREDVEDAAAHRELTAAGDEVDPGVRELGELERECGEVVPAAAGRELYRLDVDQSGDDRLQRGADRRHDDEVALGPTVPTLRDPAADLAERAQPTADGLGARAETFVRQRLPRGEVEHGRRRQVGAQRPDDGVHFAPRRGDREHRLGVTAGGEQRGEDGHPQPLDHREVGILLG